MAHKVPDNLDEVTKESEKRKPQRPRNTSRRSMYRKAEKAG